MTPTRDQLADAYIACRRSIGKDAAQAIIAKFGSSDIDEIAEPKWPQLIAALKAKTESDDWLEGRNTTPKTTAELDVSGVWARYNGDWRARRGGA